MNDLAGQDGDGVRTAILVFVGALAFSALVWRTEFFITDNWTLANTLVAVEDGHLHFEATPYGSINSPGTHRVGDRVYGRNYGQVLLSLPALWVLSVADRVLHLGVALLLAWTALLFVFAATAGDLLGRARAGAVGGGVVALALAGLQLPFVPVLDQQALPLLALQFTTMLTGALTALVTFRLVEATYDRRMGLFAAGAVVLTTPVGIWATIPKRHSITAMLALVTVYWFYRSRSASTPVAATRFRALAYVPVGVTAWIHAPEGLVLFVSLATVDLLTARSNDPGRLAIVAAAFALSVLPMLVTNAAIAGNPFEPPRALPGVESAGTVLLDKTGRLVTSGPATTPDAPGGIATGTALTALVENGVVFVQYMAGAVTATTDLERLYHVFVRGRQGLGLRRFGSQPVNLSVLESMPVLGALLSTPAVAYRLANRDRRTLSAESLRGALADPKRDTDALVVCYLAVLVVMYLPRLPLHITVTVRYLHPLYPLGVYLLIRHGAVRRVLQEQGRVLAGSYVGLAVVGTMLMVSLVATGTRNATEVLQLNAGLALAAGALLAYWAVVATFDHGYDRAGAVVLGFAGAVTTTFVLLAPVVYYPTTTRFVLPATRFVAEWLAFT